MTVLDEKNRSRYFWLDIAKTFGIFLIVLSHLSISKFTADFLWTFHVPLFFFISGYLFKLNLNEGFLKRLNSRLILPYVAIYLINVLLVDLIKADFDVNTTLSMILGMFWGTHSYPHFVNAALWFLPGLITVELIYFYLIRKSVWLYVPLLITSVSFYMLGYLNLFFSIDLALLGLNYYLAGVLVRKFNVIDRVMNNYGVLVLLFLLSVIGTLMFAKMGNVWYGGNFYVTSLAGGIVGIAMIVSLSLILEKYLKVFTWITFISGNTLFIFCFHKFSNALVNSFTEGLLAKNSLWSSMFIATLSILLLIPFNLWVIKFCPQIIGQRKRLHS